MKRKEVSLKITTFDGYQVPLKLQRSRATFPVDYLPLLSMLFPSRVHSFNHPRVHRHSQPSRSLENDVRSNWETRAAKQTDARRVGRWIAVEREKLASWRNKFPITDVCVAAARRINSRRVYRAALNMRILRGCALPMVRWFIENRFRTDVPVATDRFTGCAHRRRLHNNYR